MVGEADGLLDGFKLGIHVGSRVGEGVGANVGGRISTKGVTATPVHFAEVICVASKSAEAVARELSKLPEATLVNKDEVR